MKTILLLLFSVNAQAAPKCYIDVCNGLTTDSKCYIQEVKRSGKIEFKKGYFPVTGCRDKK